jgi:subtilase family serine protease
MTSELTNEEKVGVVNQHIKTLNYNKYNLNLTMLELIAISNPNQASINEIILQISDLDDKISVLEEEKTTLEQG